MIAARGYASAVVWVKRIGIAVGAVGLGVLISWVIIGRLLIDVWGPFLCRMPEEANDLGEVIGWAFGCMIAIIAVLSLITVVVTLAASIFFERLLVRPSSTLWTVVITLALMGLAVVVGTAISAVSG
jgi:hypothetical protein